MRVGILGRGVPVEARRAVLASVDGVEVVVASAAVDEPMAVMAEGALPDEIAVLFLEGPTAAHFRMARAAAAEGVHVFLGWPPATSLVECEGILQRAEEAGVEVGVSRPLRFHPGVATLPSDARAQLVVFSGVVSSEGPPAWPLWLADGIDLCCAMARSYSVQRIEAEAVRDGGIWPEAVAFSLRFHNGTYAQVNLRRGNPEGGTLYVGGGGFQSEVVLKPTDHRAGLVAETRAFLYAIQAGQPAPVSVLDGLQTLRLVERLMRRLR